MIHMSPHIAMGLAYAFVFFGTIGVGATALIVVALLRGRSR